MGRDRSLALISFNSDFYSCKEKDPLFYKDGCLICCEENYKVYWLYIKPDEKEIVIDSWLKTKNIFYVDYTFNKEKTTRMFGNEYGF